MHSIEVGSVRRVMRGDKAFVGAIIKHIAATK
jgi:hypothetical protein